MVAVRIMVCGSMHFAKEMLAVEKQLKEMGHTVFAPPDAHKCLERPELNMDWEHCSKLDIDKACFNLVAESDAILVVNYPKDGIEEYIGGATLMEIGLARHLDKKIFLLHGLPKEEELRYAFEVRLAKPIVLNGDLAKINGHL